MELLLGVFLTKSGERFFFQNWKFILLKIGKKSQWTLSIIKVLYNPKQIHGFFRSWGIAYIFDPLFDISLDIILSIHVSQFLCLLRTRGNGDIKIRLYMYILTKNMICHVIQIILKYIFSITKYTCISKFINFANSLIFPHNILK